MRPRVLNMRRREGRAVRAREQAGLRVARRGGSRVDEKMLFRESRQSVARRLLISTVPMKNEIRLPESPDTFSEKNRSLGPP